jgi:hypothetical protein
MKFFSILSASLLLPALVFSNPVAEPAAVPQPAPVSLEAREAAAMHEFLGTLERRSANLEERAIDLGALIANLTANLGAIGDLLKPEVLNSIAPLLTNANALLQPPFVNQTRGLIADVAPVCFVVALLLDRDTNTRCSLFRAYLLSLRLSWARSLQSELPRNLLRRAIAEQIKWGDG